MSAPSPAWLVQDRPSAWRSVAGALVLLSATVSLPAAELPGPTIPAGFGVNIHFTTGHDADLDQIAAVGFRLVRMDLHWAGTEKTRGVYDWSSYDGLVSALQRRGLRAYFIFDYSNPLYEGDCVDHKGKHGPASPQHPESVAAFAKWAAASVRHFAGQHVIWEIWNEPNGGFWKPHADAAQYATLALATARAVRAADPQATLLAPASSGFPWDFFDQVLTPDVLALLDGVSVHPYRAPKVPETALPDYVRLHELIATRVPADRKDLPIISGEWGYQTSTKGETLDQQADYLAREFLVNLSNGIPLSIWYDWIDDGPDPAEPEHHFGVVTTDHQPKPSFEAMRTLTHELSGYHFVRREPGDSQDFVLLFRNEQNDEKLAFWTTAKPHAVTAAGTACDLKSLPGYAPVKGS